MEHKKQISLKPDFIIKLINDYKLCFESTEREKNVEDELNIKDFLHSIYKEYNDIPKIENASKASDEEMIEINSAGKFKYDREKAYLNSKDKQPVICLQESYIEESDLINLLNSINEEKILKIFELTCDSKDQKPTAKNIKPKNIKATKSFAYIIIYNKLEKYLEDEKYIEKKNG